MINRIRDLKQGMICRIQLKSFAAQINGGGYHNMSDQMKFIILSIKDEDGVDNPYKKEIKFLYNGKIYRTWLSGDTKVLKIKK